LVTLESRAGNRKEWIRILLPLIIILLPLRGGKEIAIVIVGYLLHSVQHPPGNISEFSRRVVFSYFLEAA